MTRWLVDTSALVRLGGSSSAATWADRMERGLVHISTVTRLEVGYSDFDLIAEITGQPTERLDGD